MSDKIVVAQKDIEKGEEIFIDYNLVDDSSEDTSQSNQVNGGKETNAAETAEEKDLYSDKENLYSGPNFPNDKKC
jgi:hypothetical protein